MFRRTLFTLLAFGFLGNAWCETIDIFGAEDYPGICFLKDGRPQGVFPRILEGVSRFSGDTYALQLFPWKRAQLHAETGKGGIAHFSKTEEREALFDYSHVVYGDRIELVVLKGKEFPFKQFQDLKGKRVGAKFGASFGQKVDAFFASNALELQRDPGVSNRLSKLLRNRIDVAIVEGADSQIEKLIGHDPELMRAKDQFVILPVPLVDDALYLAFAKSMHRKDTLDRFNKGLDKFKGTDAYRSLMAH